MTFKELLDLCSWEDLEDFLYEFPDAGMGESRWKMEGFHRMYDELCRMTPKGSKRKIRLRKPKDKGGDYPALFTRPTANAGYLSTCSWAGYLGQEIVPPKGMELPPAALVAACMCAMSEFGYTEQECDETCNRLVEHTGEYSFTRYDLDLDVYENPTHSTKRRLMQWIQDCHAGFDIPAWSDVLTLSHICSISLQHDSWEAQGGFSKQLGLIPKQLCAYRKFWMLVNYTDFALWTADQKFFQDWVKKCLHPQAEIYILAQKSQNEWDRILPSKHVRLTIVAGR